MKMAVAQLTVKEDLCRRIMELSDDRAEQALDFIHDFEAYEPNEETIKVLEDSETGRNLLGPYDTLEDMFKDFGINVDPQANNSVQK
jgi:hypothetical protein